MTASLTSDPLTLRAACTHDLPAIEALIARSARELSVGFYTEAQVASLLRHVFGADTQLVRDGTYYVMETASDGLAAVGGWSRRRTLYGGDRMKPADDPLLDPGREPARIRAFFVRPDWARRGLGRRLYHRCEAAARAAGFHRLALVATLPGEPLYRALGFEVDERFTLALPDGIEVPVAGMSRPIDLPTPAGAEA
jgi:GNAT superfamily N-acetyltransferase